MRGAHIQNLGVRPLELPGNEFTGKTFRKIEDVLSENPRLFKINRIKEPVFLGARPFGYDHRRDLCVEIIDNHGIIYEALMSDLDWCFVLSCESTEHSARIEAMLNNGR